MLSSEILERASTEWLHVAGISRANFDLLSGSLNATELTFTVAGRVPDIPRGALLEIDSEVIAVDSVDGQTVTALARGYLNTNAASHLNGAPVYINPKFFQKTLLDHLQTVIGKFYSWGLYKRVLNEELTFPTGESALELPSGAKRVRSIRFVLPGGSYSRKLRPGKSYEQLTDFDPLKIQFISGGNPTYSLSIVYAADWDRPALGDDLSDLGIPESVQDGLPMAVAGYALQGSEIPRLNVDDIKKMLATQGSSVPVGSHLNVGRSLIQSFLELHVGPERQRLEELDGHGMEYVA